MILLRLISWPYIRKHVLRTALTTTGIVLGIAVFVGMHTANQSVLFAFSQTIDRIAGKTGLQITAGEAGFGEDVLEKVQLASTVRVAVPVIEAVVDSKLEGQGNLLVLGVDMTGDRSLRDYDLDSGEEAVIDDPLIFLAQPDSLIVSTELADRNALRIGSHLPLQTADGEKAFTVRGIMKTEGLASAFGGNLAVMDVYAAQLMFGRGRTFDRIDLAVTPGTTIADAERELTALLGPGFDIQPPASRGQQAEAMVAGYTMMVNISSVFALFIGMFIIYNSFATAVTQRRSEIGILRALGATRAQIRWLFLGESLVLGLIGSVIGLGLGIVMARAIASAISALIGELYGVAQQAADVATDPLVLTVAVTIGLVTSLVAAAVPAHNAARVDPVDALKKGSYQALSAGESRLRLILAAVLGILSIGCLTASEYRPVFFAGYAFTIAAALLLAPVLSLGLAKALRPVLKRLRPVEGALAADSLIQAPRRTSGSVAALMLSLALIVAFAGMARASYGSIVQWMNTTLNHDLYVMPSQRLDIRSTRFPATMAPEIAAVPGVERVQMYRSNRITFRGKPVMVAAIEMDSVRETAHNEPIGGSASDMYRKGAAGEGLIVADNLAQLHHLGFGDVVEIPAPYGTIRLPIVGIIADYTDQQGTVFMDRTLFVKYWRDDAVSDFRVFVEPGTSIGDVRQRIIELYAGKRHIFVLTNEEGRRYILRIADQWFGLINVQIAIAVLVAILGIVNSLTVSIMDRRRELGVLRAVGGLRGQIRRTIWLEALSIAVLGLVAGCALGAVNLYYVLQIVQRDIIGMRLDYQFPVSTMLALIPIMLGAAFAAAVLPAESAVRAPLVEALEYE
jgi:putative ABC transport system permease protein